jgi:MFS family permease
VYKEISSRRPVDTSDPENPYGYVIVFSAFLLMTVIWMSFYSFGIFFKPVLADFGWTRAATAGAFSLSSFIQGLLAIVMGGLTDRFGPRIVMTICGILIAAGYLLMSQISSMWHLYLFFSVILGVGMGGSFAPLMTLTARWFIRRRGTMTGIVAAGTGVGGLIGPPLAEALISRYGWRVSYAVIGVVVLVVMILGSQFLRSAPGHNLGAARKGDQQGDRQPGIQHEGLQFRDAVASKTFWVVFAMVFCLGFCAFVVMVHTAPHVTDIGFSRDTAARVVAAIGMACIAGRVIFGKTLDRIGSRKGFIFGFALIAFSLFLLVFGSSLDMLYLFAALFGFAFGACVTCESPIVADLFGLRSHGLLLGIIACSFTLGGAIGPFLAGYIFDVSGRYQSAFLLCAALSCSGLLLARALKVARQPASLPT